MVVNSPGIAYARSTRLDSWKSIAEYLNRSLRTVQRWYTRYHLPVHRIGGDTGSIFAYTGELDRWLTSRAEDRLHLQDQHGIHHLHARQIPANFGKGESVLEENTEQSSKLISTASRMWEQLSPDNIELIVRAYQRAILLDPMNGRAYAGLSLSLIAENLIEVLPPSSGYGSARAAMMRALESAPDLTETKSARCWLKMLVDHDWEAAESGFEGILETDDSFRCALVGRGLLFIAESRLSEARDLFIRAAELYPLSMPATSFQIWTEYLDGYYDRALMLIGEARACGHAGALLDGLDALASLQTKEPGELIERLEPRVVESLCPALLQGILGYAYVLDGQEKKARRLVGVLTDLEVRPSGQFAYAIALIHTALGEVQSAVGALGRSYDRGSLWSLGFLSDPLLAKLRSSLYFRDKFLPAKYPATRRGCKLVWNAGDRITRSSVID